jgi:ribosome-binding factor A
MKRRSRRSSRLVVPDQPPRPDRKTLQLCSQIADTLNYVLTGELDDDVLRNVYVERVEPAPDVSRLMVHVSPLDPGDPTPPSVILQHLHEASPQIRSEVAASIHRRKTPLLEFCVSLPPVERD